MTNEWTKGGGRHEDGLTFLAPGQVDVGALGHCVFVGRSLKGTSNRDLASHSTWTKKHQKVAARSKKGRPARSTNGTVASRSARSPAEVSACRGCSWLR